MNLKNAGEYIRAFLKIRIKTGEIVPLEMNAPQRRLYQVIKEEHDAGRPIRIIILKARQLGFSTLTEAILFHSSATSAGVSSLIVAHRDDSTGAIFRMSKLFYDKLPRLIRPMLKTSNAQELVFENPSKNPNERAENPGLRSRIRCVTAGGRGVGRGETLTNVHASEYAFWTGDKSMTLLGILQAVPNLPGTTVIIESTANGYDDFKKRWDDAVAGRSDFRAVFFAWYENPEYRSAVPAGTEWTEEEEDLRRTYGLDDEQLAWRRWCIRNNCGGDINKFKQEYPATPDEAFLTSGNPVFDNEKVILRREVAPEPLKIGEFEYDYDGIKITNIRFVERESGFVRIYKEPESGVPYVLGGDTAGEGSDFFIGQVLDNRTGEQVCVLRRQFDEVIYAQQMYCLGMYYNAALIGVENNYSTYPTRELERLGYRNMYVREAEDTYTHRLRQSFGFMTTSVTRPVIIANLVAVARESLELISDYDTLGEMLTFVRNEHGRAEAMDGEYDDCVMALAIAHYIRPQQSYTAEADEGERAEWTESMREDYENATADERAMLIKRWGKPRKKGV